MSNFNINKDNLELLEQSALAGDTKFVSRVLTELPVEQRREYLGAMQKDFDRLGTLDSAFPELIIYGHLEPPRKEHQTSQLQGTNGVTKDEPAQFQQETVAKLKPIDSYPLVQVNVPDDWMQIDGVALRKQVPFEQRLLNPQYWQNPYEVQILYKK